MKETLIPPKEHEWCYGHALECDGDVEVFYWVPAVNGMAWKDTAGILWHPSCLAECGWNYMRALPRRGPRGGRFVIEQSAYARLPRQDDALSWEEVERLVRKALPKADSHENEDILQEAVLQAVSRKVAAKDIKELVNIVVREHFTHYDFASKHTAAVEIPYADDGEVRI